MTGGRTIGLYGDTGSGKTTQIGEIAKDVKRTRGLDTLYVAGDLGGYRSIQPMERLGFLKVESFDEKAAADPWTWVNDATSGRLLTDKVGLVAFDSATSISEAILNVITKTPGQVGQQKTQRFTVSSGLQVGANNESHYGLVQSFMLDQIWRSTWLAAKGIDVLWTFGLDRSEKVDATLVIGPKLAGHALTSQIPKWFQYFFRMVSIPVLGSPARHLLYLQEQPDLNGTGTSFGNPRYPLDATTELPAVLEPASLVEALHLIEQGQEEADRKLREEMIG